MYEDFSKTTKTNQIACFGKYAKANGSDHQKHAAISKFAVYKYKAVKEANIQVAT